MLRMDDMRAIRLQLKLSQIELGERLGLNQSTISRMETGAMPIDRRTSLALAALVTAQEKDDPSGGDTSAADRCAPDISAESVGAIQEKAA